MARIATDPSRTGPSVKGTRRIAFILAVLSIIVIVVGSVMKWPDATSAQAGLVRLYGTGKAHISKLRVNKVGWVCGMYSLPPKSDQWKFVESRSVFWAQEKTDTWLRNGSPKQGEDKWSSCMTYPRRGRGLTFDTVNDWITGKLLGVFG
jgi:hypothetical protein